jgi:hypothetical protein
VRSRASRIVLNRRGLVAALAATMALALVPAGASATSPVLEFVVPGKAFPVAFSSEGGPVTAEMADFEKVVHCEKSHATGEITGPRSTVSEYSFTGCKTEKGASAKCKTTGAGEEEITTRPIEADLVYIDQARHEVGILLDPAGGVYMQFECGGEAVEARGAFLSTVTPINKEVTSFTATLSESGSVQSPDEYESENGERLRAIPEGKRGTKEWVPTAVAATITIKPSTPVQIKALATEEIEARQREEAQTKYQEEIKQKETAVNKRHEEEAAASKKHEEELKAQLAAVTGQLKELLAKQHPTRAQLLAKALEQCKKRPKRKRAKCRVAAERRYGVEARKKRK